MKPVETGFSDSDKEKLSDKLRQADESLKEMKIRFVHHPAAMKRKKVGRYLSLRPVFTCSPENIL